jgi:hypothetical protein
LGIELITVGPHLGRLGGNATADRSIHITDPVEYDGVIVAATPDPAMAVFVQEAYRHHKTLGFTVAGAADAVGVAPDAAGVSDSAAAFFDALAQHRHWDR